MVRTSNTKNKHNTKDLATKTSSRPKKSKKLAENQENRLFYATHNPFGVPEDGWGGHVTQKFFFQKLPNFYLQALAKFGGPLKSRF